MRSPWSFWPVALAVLALLLFCVSPSQADVPEIFINSHDPAKQPSLPEEKKGAIKYLQNLLENIRNAPHKFLQPARDNWNWKTAAVSDALNSLHLQDTFFLSSDESIHSGRSLALGLAAFQCKKSGLEDFPALQPGPPPKKRDRHAERSEEQGPIKVGAYDGVSGSHEGKDYSWLALPRLDGERYYDDEKVGGSSMRKVFMRYGTQIAPRQSLPPLQLAILWGPFSDLRPQSPPTLTSCANKLVDPDVTVLLELQRLREAVEDECGSYKVGFFTALLLIERPLCDCCFHFMMNRGLIPRPHEAAQPELPLNGWLKLALPSASGSVLRLSKSSHSVVAQGLEKVLGPLDGVDRSKLKWNVNFLQVLVNEASSHKLAWMTEEHDKKLVQQRLLESNLDALADDPMKLLQPGLASALSAIVESTSAFSDTDKVIIGSSTAREYLV